MDFAIQSASSHTQGAGPSLASRAPDASLCRVALSQCLGLRLFPVALGQTTGPGHGLVHTPHLAWSWEPGMGEPRSLRFSLDSEAATGGSSESVSHQPHSFASPWLTCLALHPPASPSPCSPPCLRACGYWTALPGPAFQAVLLFPFPLLPDSLSCHATPSSLCRHAISQCLPSRSFSSLQVSLTQNRPSQASTAVGVDWEPGSRS